MIDARQHVIGKFTCYAFETLTIDNTAAGISLSSAYLEANPRPKKAFITVEGASCRYRLDGTAPTSSVGHLLTPVSSLTLEGHSQLNNAKFIRTGGTSAVLQVSFLR